jgi:hypothetical protein
MHTSRVAKVYALVSLIVFVVWVWTLAQVLLTPDALVRRLPKVAWLVIVFLFPMLGTAGWYVFGRPETAARRPSSPYERSTPAFPEYDRPGRAAATDPEKDEEFLRQVRERAEQQRKRYEQSKKEQPPAEDSSA